MKFIKVFIITIYLLLNLSGCNKIDDISDYTVFENAYSTEIKYIDNKYSVDSDNVYVINNTIYALCHERGENDSAVQNPRSFIFSITNTMENEIIYEIPKFRENAIIDKMFICDDGNICLIDVSYDSTPKYILYYVDKDFNIINMFDLDNDIEIYQMTVSGETIFLACDNTIIAMSTNGKHLYNIPYTGILESIEITNNGNVMAKFFDASKGKDKIYYIDEMNKKLSDEIKIDTKENYNIYTGEGYELYLVNSKALHGYNSGDNITELCNWINSDVFYNEISEIFMIDENSFFTFGYDSFNGQQMLSFMQKVPENELQAKKTINLGGVYISNETLNDVVKFNRQSKEYRISVTDYTNIYSEDPDQFIFKLNTVMAGNAPPDLLEINWIIPFNEYADNGIFCNLYDYMNNDDSFDKSNIVSCVLSPLETNGKLYQFAMTFSIHTVISKADTNNWRIDNMLQMDNSTNLFHTLNLPFSGVINYNDFFGYNMAEYIDLDKGECKFATKETIELLKYLKKYSDAEVKDIYDDIYKSFRNNEIMFYNTNIGSISDYIYLPLIFGTDKFDFVGIPSKTNGTHDVIPGISYSIINNSAVKDGAWEFIKYSISNENIDSKNISYQLYSSNYAIKKVIESEKKYFNYYSYDGVNYMKSLEKLDFNMNDSMEIVLTSEYAEKFLKFINSISNKRVYYDEVMKIINEELEEFNIGRNTAEEAVNFIQNRASIYVSERHDFQLIVYRH
jgi:hypothetical protein